MKPLKFNKANLYYGKSVIPVEPNASLPLPDFDFENMDEVVFTAMSIMSNAAGGHRMAPPVLAITDDHDYVSLIGPGYSVVWGHMHIPKRASMSDAEWAAAMERKILARSVTRIKYAVITDQHGDGWKRAIRIPVTA